MTGPGESINTTHDLADAEMIGYAVAARRAALQQGQGQAPSLSAYARSLGGAQNSGSLVIPGLHPISIQSIHNMPPAPGSTGRYTLDHRRDSRKNRLRKGIVATVIAALGLGVAGAIYRPWEHTGTGQTQTAGTTSDMSGAALPFNPQTSVTVETVTGSAADLPPVVIGLSTNGPFKIAYVVPAAKGKKEVHYISTDANNVPLKYDLSLGIEAELAKVDNGKAWFKMTEKDGIKTYTVFRDQFEVQIDPNMLHDTHTVIDTNKQDDPNTEEKENEIHYNRDNTKDSWNPTRFKSTDNIIPDTTVTDKEKTRVASVASEPLLLLMMATVQSVADFQLNKCQTQTDVKPMDQLSAAFDSDVKDKFGAVGVKYNQNIKVKMTGAYHMDLFEDIRKRQKVFNVVINTDFSAYELPPSNVNCSVTYLK